MQNHKWVEDRAKHLCTCSQCGYKVQKSNDEECRGGSLHLPEKKTILTDSDKPMNSEHANFLCKVWGVKCKP